MENNQNSSAHACAADIDQPLSVGLLQLKSSLRRHQGYWQTYLDKHDFESFGNREDAQLAQTQHALARFEWLLDEGREQISGLFSREEFGILANHLLGDFSATRSGYEYAAAVCMELNIDFEEFEKSEHACLVNRLLNLTALQSAALSDALEVGWHSSPSGRFFDTIEELGISFK